MNIFNTISKYVDGLLLALAKKILRSAELFGVGIKPLLWLLFGLGFVFVRSITVPTNLLPMQVQLPAQLWLYLMVSILWLHWFAQIIIAFGTMFLVEKSSEVLPPIKVLMEHQERTYDWAFGAAMYLVLSGSLLIQLTFVLCFDFWPYLVLAHMEDHGGTTLRDMIKAGLKRLQLSLHPGVTPVPSPA